MSDKMKTADDITSKIEELKAHRSKLADEQPQGWTNRSKEINMKIDALKWVMGQTYTL